MSHPPSARRQRRITRRVRLIPEASSIWLVVAVTLVGIAASAAFFASTLADDAPITKSALGWAIAAVLVAFAIGCLLAHFDVNRGRKSKTFEIVDSDDDPTQGPGSPDLHGGA